MASYASDPSRGGKNMSTGTALQEAHQETQDARMLAREVTTVFRELVEYYHEKDKLSLQEAVAKGEQLVPVATLEMILSRPLDETSRLDLYNLSRHDPALALRRSQEVRQAAKDELESGHRAAKALEGGDSNCWERAQFLALRSDLAQGWQPRNGIESQL